LGIVEGFELRERGEGGTRSASCCFRGTVFSINSSVTARREKTNKAGG
jgi:hypothetical protein